MKTWFRTDHPYTTAVDISSVAFWSQSFDQREPTFAQLRAVAPVSWHPQLETPGLPRRAAESGFWAVTKARDIRFVSRHHEMFSSQIGQVGVRPAPFHLDENMLVTDPPRHDVLRRMAHDLFTPRGLGELEHSVAHDARRVVLLAAREGEFDFVSAVAAQLPLLTIARLLGVPASERDAFVLAADAHTRHRLGGEPESRYAEEYAESSRYLQSLFLGLADWRRRVPGDDIVSRLVEMPPDGRPLDDRAILSTLMMFILAGTDTTKQAITLSLLALDRFRDQRDWLLGDFDGRFADAFPELVRFASPIISFARTATIDIEIAGAEVVAGDKVALFYCSGNRDEDEFDDPGALDLQRAPNNHVAFGGGGAHFCLGSRLAEYQVREILRAVYQRMPELELGEPVSGFGEAVNTVVSLPARTRR
jgi:cytochrome P450